MCRQSGPADLIAAANDNSKKYADRTGQTYYPITGGYFDVNTYHIESQYEGKIKDFLVELRDAMNGKGSTEQNHNNSDIMTDYFDVGWYIDIRIGRYDRPYQVV